MTSKRILLSLGVLVLSSACGKHEKPNFIYMPDMVYSPALKAQEEGSMRKPVAGTVPRGYTSEKALFRKPGPAEQSMDVLEAGKELKNPLLRDRATLLRGQKQYNTYCIVCHGPYGEGDGSVVPKFPRPPSLQSEKIRGYADGSIFYVVSKGQNLMPSYAAQVEPKDRWAIVHYIRALHRAKQPTADDLKAYEME